MLPDDTPEGNPGRNGRPHPPHHPTWADVLGVAPILTRLEAADRQLRHAATIADREQAEAQRREAKGVIWRAGSDLADLFLLLLRCCRRHQPEALLAALVEVLRPELEPLFDAIARLEREGER
jgi:hypothetical protein